MNSMGKGSNRLRFLLVVFTSIFLLIGVIYLGLLTFDAKPGVFRKVLYRLIPNFETVELIITMIPNPKIIDGYFLDDTEKDTTHRVSGKWLNTYSTDGIVTNTNTGGIMPSYHKDLVYLIGTVVQVDPKKRTVDIEIDGNRYTLNIRPYTYYFKLGTHPEMTSSGDFSYKPTGRLVDIGLLEVGEVAYFLVYDDTESLKVISVEL